MNVLLRSIKRVSVCEKYSKEFFMKIIHTLGKFVACKVNSYISKRAAEKTKRKAFNIVGRQMRAAKKKNKRINGKTAYKNVLTALMKKEERKKSLREFFIELFFS